MSPAAAGARRLICARRVEPTGEVIGLDMTDAMLDLARRDAAEADVDIITLAAGCAATTRSYRGGEVGGVDIIVVAQLPAAPS